MAGQMTFPIEASSRNGSKSRLAGRTVSPAALSPASAPVERPDEPSPLAPETQVPAPRPALCPAETQADRGRDLEGASVSFGLWAVRLVAALNSYEHMRSLALVAGEGWRSWLLPISVDGLAIVALVKIRRARRDGRPCGMAWLALCLSLAVSLAANVAAAEATEVGRLVAAWPPIALLLAEVIDNRHRGGAGANHIAAPVPSNPAMAGGG
jgi:hypothetical protein